MTYVITIKTCVNSDKIKHLDAVTYSVSRLGASGLLYGLEGPASF